MLLNQAGWPVWKLIYADENLIAGLFFLVTNPFWDFWNIIRDYDPRPSLEKVNCPVLAVFGGKNTYLPVEKSAEIWRSSLEQAGNKDFTVRIFPNGDHSLIESKTGGMKEAARAERFVPGFFDLLLEWTLARVR